MVVPTAERVQMHTKPEINERIQRQAKRNVEYYEDHTNEIGERIEELDREWDVERVLETQFSSLTLLGTSLSLLTKKRGFLLLPLIAGGFMLQHALQGWCPPVPVFRRLGVRTQREIEAERCALERAREED